LCFFFVRKQQTNKKSHKLIIFILV